MEVFAHEFYPNPPLRPHALNDPVEKEAHRHIPEVVFIDCWTEVGMGGCGIHCTR